VLVKCPNENFLSFVGYEMSVSDYYVDDDYYDGYGDDDCGYGVRVSVHSSWAKPSTPH
jgi:hypothetical protein